MQLKINYDEAERLIHEKSGKEMPLCYGGPHTIRITHKVHMMGSVDIDLSVEGIQGTDLILSFNGGAGIEYMLSTALKQARRRNPNADMVELFDGNKLRVSLARDPSLTSVRQNVTLQDIHFDERSIMVDFRPRNL